MLTPFIAPTMAAIIEAAGPVLAPFVAVAATGALGVAAVLALIMATATPAHAPGLPPPVVSPDELRLRELVAKQAAGTLTPDEEAELIALLAKVKGIHVQRLEDLLEFTPPVHPKLIPQTITNKFPDEPLSTDGKVVPYTIVDGNITGVNGRRQLDFVIDDSGKLVIGSKHHTLGNRQPVQAAGQIRLNGKGQIRQIDSLSGHHQPSVAQSEKFPEILKNAGLNVKGATMVTHRIKTNSGGLVTGIKVISSKKIQ